MKREKTEYGYHAARHEWVPTGKLRLIRRDTYRTYREPKRRTWYDRGAQRVESQIADILRGFYELALSTRERRRRDEEAARTREAAERRQNELEAVQEANAKLVEQLERDAGAWHRARYLRRYVRAARRALGSEVLSAVFRTEAVDFLAWAQGYVNQLDPLASEGRAEAFEARLRYGAAERDKAALARLLGGEWKESFKLGTDYTPQKDAEAFADRWNRSVFEMDSEGEEAQ